MRRATTALRRRSASRSTPRRRRRRRLRWRTTPAAANTDHITNNGTLTVTPAEAGGTIQYSIDGGTTWTGSFTAAEGANTVEVRQVDAAGNLGTAATLSFTLDTKAPAAPTVVLAHDTALGGDNTDHITNNGTLTVTPARGRRHDPVFDRRRHDVDRLVHGGRGRQHG